VAMKKNESSNVRVWGRHSRHEDADRANEGLSCSGFRNQAALTLGHSAQDCENDPVGWTRPSTELRESIAETLQADEGWLFSAANVIPVPKQRRLR